MDRAKLEIAFENAIAAGDDESATEFAVMLKEMETSPEANMTASERAVAQEGNFYWDQIMSRYADLAGFMGSFGASQFAGDLVDKGVTDPAILEELQRVSKEDVVGNAAREALGVKGIRPENTTQEYAGIAAAGLLDPITILTAPIAPIAGAFRATSLLPSLARSTLNFGGSLALGSAQETVGYGVAKTVQGVFEGSDMEEGFLDYLLRFSGAMAGGVAVGAAPRGAVGIYKASSAAVDKLKSVDNISDILADAAVKNFVDVAATSGGANWARHLENLKAVQAQNPDIVLPLVAGIGENAIVRKEFERLYRMDLVVDEATGKRFRQAYAEAAQGVKGNLQIARDAAGIKLDESQLTKIVDEAAEKATQAALDNLAVKEQVDNALATVASRFRDTPNSENIVKAAENIAVVAEKAARAMADPFYDDAFNYLRNLGVDRVPKSLTESIWRDANRILNSDVFKAYPQVVDDITSIWGPKTVDAIEILGPRGQVLAGGKSLEFPEPDLSELKSLKNELARVSRIEADPGRKDSIDALRASLQTQIEAIDPMFAKMWRNADIIYKENVGLPFSAEGYRSFDSARLYTTAVGHLSKADQIRDYLRLAGEGGVAVVQDAFMVRAAQAVIKDDKVDPRALSRFMNQNYKALNEVPSVRQMFQDEALLMDRMMVTQNKLNEQYAIYAAEQTEGFFKAIGGKSVDKVAGDMLTNIQTRKQYLNQINSLSPESRDLAMSGVRQGMLNQAFKDNKMTIAQFVDAHKPAFVEFFGTEFVDNVQTMSTLNELAKAAEEVLGLRPTIQSMRESPVKEVTGLTGTEIIGTLRNQILSAWRKALHLGSKAAVVKASEKADRTLMNIMLDPNNLDKAMEAAKNFDMRLKAADKDQAAQAAREFLTVFGNTIGTHITTSAIRGAAGATMADDDKRRPLSRTQEELRELFPYANGRPQPNNGQSMFMQQ